MIGNSVSFNRHIRRSDIIAFVRVAKGFSQTIGLWWNRTEDDLDEYVEFSMISTHGRAFELHYERHEGPWQKPLTEDFEFDVESGDLSELNKLYDWLVSQPERFWGVQFILDDHEIDHEFYEDFVS